MNKNIFVIVLIFTNVIHASQSTEESIFESALAEAAKTRAKAEEKLLAAKERTAREKILAAEALEFNRCSR